MESTMLAITRWPAALTVQLHSCEQWRVRSELRDGQERRTGTDQVGASNAYYGNTSGALHNFPSLPGDVTLTGSPFTNPSGGDFTLNNTAGAGLACQAVGFPSSLP